MKLKKLNNKGFSLMEMLVVLFIISLLLLLIIPNLNDQRENAQETGSEAFVASLQTQVDLYLMENPGTTTVAFSDLPGDPGQRATELGITISGNKVIGPD